ncbi:Aminodeoxyfutalosine deaminase [Lacunisphaera limnophila]|uniref:Aminodeoxyfutalosine deaminase n=1 Tax=Lacunisphaera limnophila TaxID=1838286 RepID=A0A1D8AY20_9BACT|nr:adenosine deaminase [Lacunisphaera limnophila]AOS45780.1 Aminodeoxyfutalosine deaminase [Lacunisphaera limnophila]
MPMDSLSFAQSLPKTETHLHLEGALPLELLRRVRPEFAQPPISWAHNFKFRDFAHFDRELLDMAFSWFTSPARYHEAAQVIFARLAAANVKYVETSFASGALEFLGLNGREVLAAIRTAVPAGLEVRVFLGIHHNGAGPRMMPILEEALTWPDLAGVDLHGFEDAPVEPWTAPYWAAARAAGKYTKAHAGEFMGADFVRKILDELQPHRIEHGTRAIESPAVVQELIRRGIALDMCPISNHKLMPGISLVNHPIRRLFDAGVKVTISTDDPITFGNRINDEYVVLADRSGFTRRELVQIARNGFEVALMPAEQKQPWLDQLDGIADALGQ